MRESGYRAAAEIIIAIAVSNRIASDLLSPLQVELHPFLQRKELVQYCRSKGIALEAYSPLCKASRLSDERIVSLAAKKGITAAQLLIR